MVRVFNKDFTEDEILSALECCVANIACRNCPLDFLDYSSQCTSVLAIGSLDIIKRQKVEIDSLKIANEKMYTANQEQQAQIEHLTAELDGLKRFIRDLIKD